MPGRRGSVGIRWGDWGASVGRLPETPARRAAESAVKDVVSGRPPSDGLWQEAIEAVAVRVEGLDAFLADERRLFARHAVAADDEHGPKSQGALPATVAPPPPELVVALAGDLPRAIEAEELALEAAARLEVFGGARAERVVWHLADPSFAADLRPLARAERGAAAATAAYAADGWDAEDTARHHQRTADQYGSAAFETASRADIRAGLRGRSLYDWRDGGAAYFRKVALGRCVYGWACWRGAERLRVPRDPVFGPAEGLPFEELDDPFDPLLCLLGGGHLWYGVACGAVYLGAPWVAPLMSATASSLWPWRRSPGDRP